MLQFVTGCAANEFQHDSNAAHVFLWTSPINETVGQENVGAKTGALISIEEN